MMNESTHTPVCPFYHQAVELIGRRWTGAILQTMYDGETRFSEIALTIPGLSDRLLSERLKELEREGLVRRTVYPETPVRIEYHLTEKGRALGDVMGAIADWAHVWLATAGVEPGTTAAITDSTDFPAGFSPAP